MKTSTKLLTIFFICIPVSLLAYNYLLQKEYKKKHFIREYYSDESAKYAEKKLPSFKHVVIEGSLKFGNLKETGYEGSIRWMPRVAIRSYDNGIKGSKPAINTISVVKEYVDVMQTRVKNDTLYVSFRTKSNNSNIGSLNNPLVEQVRIKATDIVSVNADCAYVTIGDKPSNADSLKLSIAGFGFYDVNNLYINKLKVSASAETSFNLYGTNRIKNLYYSLADTSKLSLSANTIEKLHPVRADSLTSIQINYKAKDIKKLIY